MPIPSPEYNRDVTVWGSADGSDILIKDLTTPHLVNIINWVKKHNRYTQVYPTALYEFLEEEAKLRTLLSFAKNEAIPVKLDTGYYTTRNQSFIGGAKSLFYKHRSELVMRYRNRKIITKLLKILRIKR